MYISSFIVHTLFLGDVFLGEGFTKDKELSVGSTPVAKWLHTIGQKYWNTSILQHRVEPSGMCLVGRGFILQQDNDNKQKCKLCRNDQEKGTRW